MEARERVPPVVVVVDPRANALQELTSALEAVAFEVRRFGHADALLQALHEDVPDCILLALPGHPDAEWTILRSLRGAAPATPVIVPGGECRHRPRDFGHQGRRLGPPRKARRYRGADRLRAGSPLPLAESLFKDLRNPIAGR